MAVCASSDEVGRSVGRGLHLQGGRGFFLAAARVDGRRSGDVLDGALLGALSFFF